MKTKIKIQTKTGILSKTKNFISTEDFEQTLNNISNFEKRVQLSLMDHGEGEIQNFRCPIENSRIDDFLCHRARSPTEITQHPETKCLEGEFYCFSISFSLSHSVLKVYEENFEQLRQKNDAPGC
jgi:hypothetical protein